MPDEPIQGQEPNKAGQEPAPATNGPADQESGEEFDKERALATIRKLREAEKLSKQQAKELETLRSQAKAAEEAQLTEQQRLAKRSEDQAAKLADLERQQADWARERQELTTRQEVLAESARLNIVDPDAAYRLLDLAALEYDDAGKPKNVKAVLQALVKGKPYLVASAGGGSPANPARGNTTDPQETPAARRLRLQGGGFNPFDPASVKQKGGGIFYAGDKPLSG